MSAGRALFGRALARLAARRTILASVVMGILALLVSAAITAYSVSQREAIGMDRAATLRTQAWGEAGGFFELFLLILAALLGCGQIAGDIREGTLFSVLARPVSRSAIFLSSWCASALILTSFEAVRALIVLTSYASLGGALDAQHLLGTLSMMIEHLLLLSIFTALGAGLSSALACVLGIALFVLPSIVNAPFVTGAARTALRVLTSVMPAWTSSNMIQSAALVGQQVSIPALIEVQVYRAAWIALLLVAGAWIFGRRELAPRV